MSVKYTSYQKEFLTTYEQAIDRALDICGGMAESHAKVNLARNHSVRTNRLRGSIKHVRVDKNTEAVGTNVEYAPYVELGHHQEPGRYVPAIKKRLKASWVAPKPYLRPAVENHKEQYKKVIANELKV